MRSYIERNEPVKLLDKGLGFPLTLVVAAPGSGKSVLLTQWQAHLISDSPGFINDSPHSKNDSSQRTALIRIDLSASAGNDHNSHIVFRKIIEGIKTLTPLWDASFFNLFNSESPVTDETLIAVLIEALELVDNQLVIILDDFHHIKSLDCQAIFADLIERLPVHVHFVLASRRYPQFPLSRFKLEERVFVLDGNDLKLQKTELAQLNESISGEPLSDAKVSELLSQTEGWFVGVKLALQAYSRSGDPALEAFNGTQPELLNYFGFEVLKNLSDELRHFVLSSVVFECFDSDLCEQVLDIDNCAQILEKVAMQELFLMPVLEQPGCYRYHPLLQSFLLNRLKSEHSQAYIENLYRKSAQYFLDKGQIAAAIEYASQANDLEFYAAALEIACHLWLKLGDFEPVIDALLGLNERDLERHANLLVPLIYALSFTRRFNQAHYYLEILQRNSPLVSCEAAGGKGSKRLDESLQIDRFLAHLLRLFQRDTDAMNDSAMLAFSHKHANHVVRGLSMIIVAYEKVHRGELTDAFKIAHEAKSLLVKIEHKFLESYADLLIILCDRYLGRGVEAIQYMTEIYKKVRGGPKTPFWVNIATGMMIVYYEQNALSRAIDLCEALLPVVNRACVTEVVASCYLYFSRLLHIGGEASKAKRLLDQLDRILTLGKYERFHSQIVQEKVRQAVVDDLPVVIDKLYQQYDLISVSDNEVWKRPGVYHESCERFALAAVYCLVSKNRIEQANAILLQMLVVLDRHEMKTRSLIVRCNQITIGFMQGNTDAAINHLKKMIQEYGLVCFSRTVFDESPALAKVFQQAINLKRIALPTIFTDIFKDFLKPTECFNDLVKPARLLTEKELEIFELLSAGLTNAEISKQSCIALSTTKWHLKNIYMKLGVVNRSAAMMIAHQS